MYENNDIQEPVATQIAALRSELEQLKAEASARKELERRRAARRTRVFKWSGLLALPLVLVATVAIADPVSKLECVVGVGDLYCFQENTPAKASEINHNFLQLKAWLVNKTGDVASSDIAASNITATGAISATGNITSSGNLLSSTGFVGVGPHGTSYVHFSHRDRTAAGDYALLQSQSGTTFVNAPTGESINFRINNINVAHIDVNGLEVGYAQYTCPTSQTVCTCPAGLVPIGGGVACYHGSYTTELLNSFPTSTGWSGTCAGNVAQRVHVICADIQ